MEPRKHEETKKHTKKKNKFSVLAVLLLAVACHAPDSSKGTASGLAAPSALTIAVIPKGTSHVFWQSIHAGANQAAQELGVTVIWRGPLREDDRDAQVSDVEGFYKKAEALLSRYKKPDGTLGIDGLFCSNESGTFAMNRVLHDNGWTGKVRFVGFDASPNLVGALDAGDLDGLVVQDPVRMGYLGVETMVAHMRGQPVEKVIDTGD